MLKAGALVYAIILSVVVGVFCFLLTLNNSLILLQHDILQNNEDLVTTNTSAQNYFLGKINILNEQQEEIELFGKGIKSYGELINWGGYQVLLTRSSTKEDTISSSVLIGFLNSKKDKALYLMDTNKPLYMVGKAKITGDVFLPEAGIKTGYIGKQAFNNHKFLEGKKYTSNAILPKLEDMFSNLGEGDFINMEQVKRDSILYNSFLNPLKKVLVMGQNQLYQRKISGKILVESKDSLFIRNNNQLEDVIIKAPKVVFESGFRGVVQVIASEKIQLQKNVVLKYPSCIVVQGNNNQKKEIFIDSSSKILGAVILDNKSTAKTNQIITINKKAKVIGDVYSNGEIQLKGSVIGAVYTSNFYLKTKAASYNNYILDGTINRKELHEDFIGVFVIPNMENKNNYAVIKSL